MFLWIGNGAVLKRSSQWQLILKLDNSVHELFIFKIPIIEIPFLEIHSRRQWQKVLLKVAI